MAYIYVSWSTWRNPQTRPQSANRRRTRLQSNPHRGTKSFWSDIRRVGEAPARFGAGEQHAVHRRRGVPGNIRPYGECTDADPCWCQWTPGLRARGSMHGLRLKPAP